MGKLGDLLHHILTVDFADRVAAELPALIAAVYLSINEPTALAELFHDVEQPLLAGTETGPVQLSLKLAEETEEFMSKIVGCEVYEYLLQNRPQGLPNIAVTLCARCGFVDFYTVFGKAEYPVEYSKDPIPNGSGADQKEILVFREQIG